MSPPALGEEPSLTARDRTHVYQAIRALRQTTWLDA